MNSIKLNAAFAEVEFSPKDTDRDAAWDLYVELLTRVATQYLEPDYGDEVDALSSVHELFELTRTTLRRHGRHCTEFAKIAIVVLNQIVRPFAAKWHKLALGGAFQDEGRCREFRQEISLVQKELRKYTKMLADLANVEDMTTLECVGK